MKDILPYQCVYTVQHCPYYMAVNLNVVQEIGAKYKRTENIKEKK